MENNVSMENRVHYDRRRALTVFLFRVFLFRVFLFREYFVLDNLNVFLVLFVPPALLLSSEHFSSGIKYRNIIFCNFIYILLYTIVSVEFIILRRLVFYQIISMLIHE